MRIIARMRSIGVLILYENLEKNQILREIIREGAGQWGSGETWATSSIMVRLSKFKDWFAA